MDKDELIEILKKEIKEKNQTIQYLNMEYYKLITSKSWKLTAPIRKFTGSFKYVKKIAYKVTNRLNITVEANDFRRHMAYDSEYQDNIDYSEYQTDIKALAFYLPQFHTFKENDEWWGKGFTEWTNTKKSRPNYSGHYQPREPHEDIGFYDLNDVEVLKKQAQLAKKHGVYGFCFYYYWFSGKQLMEKPVDLLLKHPEIDINFCLCWANENWTRTWDGKNTDVLIEQEYSKKDPKLFMQNFKKYIDDKRYIRVNNKPVIMVYNPTIIPNLEKVIEEWRKEAKKLGIGEILVWTRNLIVNNQEIIKGADAEFDFPPLEKGFQSSVLSGVSEGYLFYYRHIVEEMKKLYKNHVSDRPFYYGSTMGWDNSARRKTGFTVLHGYSLRSFYEWNRAIIEQTRIKNPEEERFIFINAWNEWCEGTYLDPDKKYGYANINTLSKALFDLPFECLKVIGIDDNIQKKIEKKIAVQVHLYHTDLVQEIIEQLNYIPYSFDCYITAASDKDKQFLEQQFKKCKAKQVIIDVYQNRGRDVAPFLIQMNQYYLKYDYICHIHTKKSKTVAYGDDWRRYLYNHLFGSKQNLTEIFNMFETDEHLGLIYPEIYPVIVDQVGYYENNLKCCKHEFKRLGIPKNFINNELMFPAGTMFWAKVDAIRPIFETKYKFYDFAKENGQLDATTAHAIERIFGNLIKSTGYKYQKVFNNTLTMKVPTKKRLLLFSHYEKDQIISEQDIEYLKKMQLYAKNIILITNAKNSEIKKVQGLIMSVINNEEGFDFGSWKKAFCELTNQQLKEYDEIILANNGSFLTKLSFDHIFEEMHENDVMGLCYSLLLEVRSSKFMKSDFIVMSKKVFMNTDIIDFFKNCKICKILDEKKRLCNYEFQKILEKNNFKYNVFIKESEYINDYLVNIPMDLKSPYLMLLLCSPLLNKGIFNNIDEQQSLKIIDFMKQIK